MSGNNGSSITRRSILKSAGVAGTGVAGATGIVSGETDENSDRSTAVATKRKNQKKKLENGNNINKLINKHAKDLLQQLHNYDIIKRPNVSVLATDEKHTDKNSIDLDSDVEGVAVGVFAEENDIEPTTLISIAKTYEQYRISIRIQPENNESYAFVKSTSGGERFVIDPDKEPTKLDLSNESPNGGAASTSTRPDCDGYVSCGADCLCINNGRNAAYQAIEYECTTTGTTCQCWVTGEFCDNDEVHCSTCTDSECGTCCDADCPSIWPW